MPPPTKGRPNEQPLLDRAGVDRLVVEHLPAVLGLAQRLTGNADLAEDLVQEALCRVLKRWPSFRGECQFRTWMMQIVVNADRDFRRRESRRKTEQTEQLAETPSREPEASDRVAAADLAGRVRQVIAGLPDRQREVALLCLGEGMAAGEAAEVLQTTVANVHTCLHLARKRIATSIGERCAESKPS